LAGAGEVLTSRTVRDLSAGSGLRFGIVVGEQVHVNPERLSATLLWPVAHRGLRHLAPGTYDVPTTEPYRTLTQPVP
jgi:hypothetical protein